VLSFDGDEVFNADITLFNNATAGNNYLDMSSVDASFRLQTGCMKVIFLNRFVQDLLVGFRFFALSGWIVLSFSGACFRFLVLTNKHKVYCGLYILLSLKNPKMKEVAFYLKITNCCCCFILVTLLVM